MAELENWVAEVGQGAVAQALGCSPSLVSHWLRGRKRLTPEWGAKIEAASAGQVTCESLFPGYTWYREAGRVVGYRVRLEAEPARAA